MCKRKCTPRLPVVDATAMPCFALTAITRSPNRFARSRRPAVSSDSASRPARSSCGTLLACVACMLYSRAWVWAAMRQLHSTTHFRGAAGAPLTCADGCGSTTISKCPCSASKHRALDLHAMHLSNTSSSTPCSAAWPLRVHVRTMPAVRAPMLPNCSGRAQRPHTPLAPAQRRPRAANHF